jgi:hypothetical protein
LFTAFFEAMKRFDNDQIDWIYKRQKLMEEAYIITPSGHQSLMQLNDTGTDPYLAPEPLARDLTLFDKAPPAERFEEPPEITFKSAYEAPIRQFARVDPLHPTPECFFIKPEYSNRSLIPKYDFQKREAEWKQKLHDFTVGESYQLSLDGQKDAFWNLSDEAASIARMKLEQASCIGYLEPTLMLLHRTWLSMSEGLATLVFELDVEDDEAFRYCDNNVIYYLLMLLDNYNDASIANFGNLIERWLENVMLWTSRNYRGYYTKLAVHSTRVQREFLQELYEEDIHKLECELDDFKRQNMHVQISIPNSVREARLGRKPRTSSQPRVRSESSRHNFQKMEDSWRSFKEQERSQTDRRSCKPGRYFQPQTNKRSNDSAESSMNPRRPRSENRQ